MIVMRHHWVQMVMKCITITMEMHTQECRFHLNLMKNYFLFSDKVTITSLEPELYGEPLPSSGRVD